MRWRTSARRVSRPTQPCRNEGCGRPAEGPFCDTCALEWALFHREQRLAGRSSAPPRPR